MINFELFTGDAIPIWFGKRMKLLTPSLLATICIIAAGERSEAVVISFLDQPGSLSPDLSAIFSPSGQTFTDIGTTLEESFLQGVDLTVRGMPGSSMGAVTFNPNGSFILSDDVTILFGFSIPVSGAILGHAGWSEDPNGTLSFGPDGSIGPGRNAINFDRLTVDGLTVSNDTGETFFQSSVAFSFTATSTASVAFTGSYGVLQLDVVEVVPEPSTAVLALLGPCIPLISRRRR